MISLLLNSVGGAIPSGKPALIKGDKTLTYQELIKSVSSFSNLLIKEGIKPGSIAGLYINDPVKFIISNLALWNLSSAAAPINTRLTDDEIQKQLNHAGIKHIITDTELNLIDCEIIQFNFTESNNSEGFFQVKTDSDIPAVYIFTSGSSGVPKAAAHSLKTLYNSFTQSNSRFTFTSEKSWAATLPLYHIGGFQIFMRAFFSGAAVIIPEELKNEFILDALYQHQPAYISLVPTQLKQFVDDGIRPPKTLEILFLGGGFSESSLIERAKANGWPVIKVYGSTETGSMITASGVNEDKVNSSGKALSGVSLKIMDKGKEAKPGVIGEIYVKCNSLFTGYLNGEALYSSRFNDGYYITGDFGRVDEEGNLFVEARREDLIISGGENISPFEIEEVLLSYTGVKEAVVFQMEDSKWGHIPAAALVLESKINPDVLETYLRERLAGYKLPRRIFYLEQIPKTALGKIIREKVKELCSSL